MRTLPALDHAQEAAPVGELARRDLWRAVAERLLLRLPSGRLGESGFHENRWNDRPTLRGRLVEELGPPLPPERPPLPFAAPT